MKHEESGSENEWTEDEEEGTALASVEPFAVVADTLRAVQAHSPARFQVHGCAVLMLCMQRQRPGCMSPGRSSAPSGRGCLTLCPARQALTSGMDAAGQAALQAVMLHAEALRLKPREE